MLLHGQVVASFLVAQDLPEVRTLCRLKTGDGTLQIEGGLDADVDIGSVVLGGAGADRSIAERRRAFHDAASAPSGPVFVALPMDVLDDPAPHRAPAPTPIRRRTIPSDIDELAALIALWGATRRFGH